MKRSNLAVKINTHRRLIEMIYSFSDHFLYCPFKMTAVDHVLNMLDILTGMVFQIARSNQILNLLTYVFNASLILHN